MNFMRLFHNLERVEQFKTRHQKHYANDADKLVRCGFFNKSKARVAKHDDQSKDHHEGTSLDQSYDQREHICNTLRNHWVSSSFPSAQKC